MSKSTNPYAKARYKIQHNLYKYLEEGMECELESILSKIIFNKPEKHYFDINQKSYIEKRFMNTTGG